MLSDTSHGHIFSQTLKISLSNNDDLSSNDDKYLLVHEMLDVINSGTYTHSTVQYFP